MVGLPFLVASEDPESLRVYECIPLPFNLWVSCGQLSVPNSLGFLLAYNVEFKLFLSWVEVTLDVQLVLRVNLDINLPLAEIVGWNEVDTTRLNHSKLKLILVIEGRAHLAA